MLRHRILEWIVELDKKLSKEASLGRFDASLVIDAILSLGFSSCFYFDAGDDLVSKDRAIILTKYSSDANILDPIGKKILFHDSALASDEHTEVPRVVIVSPEENKVCSKKSYDLARSLEVHEKCRAHVPIFRNGRLIGGFTCAWDGAIKDLNNDYEYGLILISSLAEKYITQASEFIVEKNIKKIRDEFKNRYRKEDEILDTAVKLIRIAVDGMATSVFHYNWYTGTLSKTHESIGVKTKKRLTENYPVGKFLTGLAWEDKRVRYIIDFDEYRKAYNHEISNESLEYHTQILGGIKSVLYCRVGSAHKPLMIRVFNRSDDARLPLTVSQQFVLEKICDELSIILDDVVVARRLSKLQELSGIALGNITNSQKAFDAVEKNIYEENVKVLSFFSFDIKTKHLTHCYSPKQSKLCNDQPKTWIGEEIFESAFTKKKIAICELESGSKTKWKNAQLQSGVTKVLVVPIKTAYKYSAIIVGFDSAFSKGKILERVPSTHLDTLKAYLTIINACVEAEESHLTSNAARRLVAAIGHEIQGPTNVVTQAAIEMLEEVATELVDMRAKTNSIGIKGSIDNMIKQVDKAEDYIDEKLLDVSYVMKMVGDLAQNPGGEEPITLNFRSYDLSALLKNAAEEVILATKIYDAFNNPVNFRFVFNDGCYKFKRMTGDENLLRKVFVNVMTNAVKYSLPPGGGRTIIISIFGIPQINQSIVQVRNFGFSIRDHEQEFIFKAFQRGAHRDDKNTRRGMGLGLYMARRIVSAHDGEIFVESSKRMFSDRNRNEDEGWETVFEIRLPLNMSKGVVNRDV